MQKIPEKAINRMSFLFYLGKCSKTYTNNSSSTLPFRFDSLVVAKHPMDFMQFKSEKFD